MSEAAPAIVVLVERELAAPIDEVYAAWTEPKLMALWLSPTGVAEVEADVRVGGAFRVVMVGDDMSVENTGEYVVVDPPTRLSFTWSSLYTGPTPGLVTVTLAAHGDTTLLKLTHEGLVDGNAKSHRGGWIAIVERLAQLLARAEGDRGR